uniref:ORF99 n=1 Tax=Pinus koraiensis TaxID=88728 RepID=A4QM15_PINKO|nr:ORF99 [Pinus koraiensis]
MKKSRSQVYQGSVFGSDFVDQSFPIHIFVGKIFLAILYIETRKIPNRHLHSRVFCKTPEWLFPSTRDIPPAPTSPFSSIKIKIFWDSEYCPESLRDLNP